MISDEDESDELAVAEGWLRHVADGSWPTASSTAKHIPVLRAEYDRRGTAEKELTEELAAADIAEADRKVECPATCPTSFVGPRAETELVEHFLAIHAARSTPEAPTPPENRKMNELLAIAQGRGVLLDRIGELVGYVPRPGFSLLDHVATVAARSTPGVPELCGNDQALISNTPSCTLPAGHSGWHRNENWSRWNSLSDEEKGLPL